MPPAARVGDMHTCPMLTVLVPHVGGPIMPPGAPTVSRKQNKVRLDGLFSPFAQFSVLGSQNVEQSTINTEVYTGCQVLFLIGVREGAGSS